MIQRDFSWYPSTVPLTLGWSSTRTDSVRSVCYKPIDCSPSNSSPNAPKSQSIDPANWQTNGWNLRIVSDRYGRLYPKSPHRCVHFVRDSLCTVSSTIRSFQLDIFPSKWRRTFSDSLRHQRTSNWKCKLGLRKKPLDLRSICWLIDRVFGFASLAIVHVQPMLFGIPWLLLLDRI